MTAHRRRGVALPTVVTALAAVLFPVQAASADDGAPVVGVVVAHDDGVVRQSVDISDLYPTASRQVVFLLEGPERSAARRMQVGVGDLVDVENTCNRPERNEGDTTCHEPDAGGELSGYLRVVLTAGRETSSGGAPSCAPVGHPQATALAELRSSPVVVGLPDDDGVLCVLATFEHAERDGDNVTQTDSVEFDLQLAFDGATVISSTHAPGPGDVVVAGRSQDAVTPAVLSSGVLDLSLPRTGLPVGTLLLGGGTLLGLGAALVLATARRDSAHRRDVKR